MEAAQNKLDEYLKTGENIEAIIGLMTKILSFDGKNNLLFILKKYIYDEKIRNFIKQNITQLLKKAQYDQLAIILLLNDEINIDSNINRLANYVRHNKVTPYSKQYQNLEKLIIYDYLDQFFELLDRYLEKSKTDLIKHIGTGRSSSAIRVGDYALKIGEVRSTPYFDDKFYRFIKRSERIILDNPRFYFEVQPFIEYNPDDITGGMIDRLKEDCLNHGYKLLDCHKYDCAILKDYRLAEIDGQEIPKQFIKEPIILVDVDAIKKI